MPASPFAGHPLAAAPIDRNALAQIFDDPQGRRLRRLRQLGTGLLLATAAATLSLWQAIGHDVWAGPAGAGSIAAAGDVPHDWLGVPVLPFEHQASITEAWLDTLKQRHQHVAFVVPGTEALKSPELLRRVVAEGHAVIAAPYSGRPPHWLAPRDGERELAATQLMLAGVLGQEALWARCASGSAATHDSAELMQRLAPRGLSCLPVRRPGEAGDGPQLLFKPGALKDAPPVEAALALQAALAERAAQDAAPAPALSVLPATTWRQILAACTAAALHAADAALRALVWLALALVGVFLVRFTALSWLMLARAHRKAQAASGAAAFDETQLPPVTVIVPAYNEEAVIVATVRSLLACRYPHPVQVIVVDDGSRDATYAQAQRHFVGHPQVRVLTQSNGGKCAALNHGIAEAGTEIVVCIDADTQLDADALRLLCRHFADPSVGAVAGNPKVGNRRNLLTRVQALEYVTLDSIERQAMEGCNAITCITGALGAYRRTLVQRLGGYTHDTLAEDTDMTLHILRSGARVLYEEDAVAWTEAPETLRDFMKQRFRWMHGTVQAAFKHRRSLFALQTGSFGLIAMPYLLLLQVGAGCLLTPLVDVTAMLGLSWLVFDSTVNAWLPGLGDLLQWLERFDAALLVLLMATTLAAFGMAAVALHLDGRERLRSLVWLLPMQLVYRVLLGFTAYRCIARALSGRRLGWGSLKRTGHVAPQRGVEVAAEAEVEVTAMAMAIAVTHRPTA